VIASHGQRLALFVIAQMNSHVLQPRAEADGRMMGEKIAHALGLRRMGSARWHGACPCCGYRSGFAITERHNGPPLVYCNAGGCGQAELVAALRCRGLWPSYDHKEAHSGNDLGELPLQREAKARERQRKIMLAADMWGDAYDATGTLIETYLRSRDILLPVPPAIRMLGMHGAYGRHPTGSRRPQMIALVEDVEHGPVAVHRSFLAIDGSGKASLDPVRMSQAPLPAQPSGSFRLARSSRSPRG
jgi:putative DNA primase/helicase